MEKTIGAAGGTLASADGLLTIDVPAGALVADTQLGVQPLTNTAPNGLGPGLRLTPGNTTFSTPVKLTFKPSADLLAGTVLALTGVGFQDASGFWRRPLGVERDEANGSVSVATTHFSDWSLIGGAQLRPPSASVRTGHTLTLTAIDCYTEEEQLAPLPGQEPDPPRFDCDPPGEQLAPLPLRLSNWSVNGIAGGNSTVGSVRAQQGNTAIYSAPSQQPDPSTVTVSVDASNLQLDGQRVGRAILISQVSIGGEIQTYRGTFNLSYQRQSADSAMTFNAAGTVEFGRPTSSSSGMISFSVTSANSTGQLTDARYTFRNAKGEVPCTPAGPVTAKLLGNLIVHTSPSEHALQLFVGGPAETTCQVLYAEPPYTYPWSTSDAFGAWVGAGDPGNCMAPKFVPSAPDGTKLEGTASWNCTGADGGTQTATLTWSLTGY